MKFVIILLTNVKFELYSGLLKASQYVAAGLNDLEQSVAAYVKDTFDAIRDHILSEQIHANTAGTAID